MIDLSAYDAAGRIQSATLASVSGSPDDGSAGASGRVTQYGYNGDNRLTSTTIGAVGQENLVTSTSYDTGGRIIGKTDANGIATVYTRSANNQVVTATVAGQGTTVTARNLDGRKASVTGSAVVACYYTYDFDPLGRPRTTVNLSSPTGRVQATSYDLVGRIAEEDSPGYGSTGTIVVTHSYNAQGLLQRIHTVLQIGSTTIPITGDQMTVYDALGAIYQNGLVLASGGDQNGQFTAASTDRFSTTTLGCASDSFGNLCLESQSMVFIVNNDGTQQETTSSWTQIGGFSRGLISKTTSYDKHNNQTVEAVTVDSGHHWQVDRTAYLDGSSLVKTSAAGLLIEEAAYDSGSSLVHWTAYTYDSLGRLTGDVDSRSGNRGTDYVYGTYLAHHSYDVATAV